MEWYETLILLFSFLVFLFLLGVPVAFSFLIVNLVAAYIFMGGIEGIMGLVTGIFTSITTFALVPVPLFILMGSIIFHSGLGFEAINVLDKWLGKIRGRLSILAILMGVIIGALSGSTIATCALLGTTLLPEMLRRGYSKRMSLGPIMGIGTVDALIPPNALTVVLASLAKVDVGKLLIAGILPGIFMSGLYLLYVIVFVRLRPEEAPSYEVEKASLSERMKVTFKYLIPLGFIVFMVIGLIFLGVATPTEAAATGALGSFLLASLYRKMNLEIIKKSIMETTKITTMIFMIIIVSDTYSAILAFTGSASSLIEFVTKLQVSPYVILTALMITILILGCFMETVAIMMITVPIFMPVIQALGFDPLWFSVLMLINMETGLLTPPFGVTLFVMKGVSPKEITMADIWKAAIPFALVDYLCLAFVIAMPKIALYLPSLMR